MKIHFEIVVFQVPSTPAKCGKRWQLPNCIGTPEGKQIQIISSGRGYEYFNYAGYHSIFPLALVDAAYKITWFSVSCDRRAGDAKVFRDSSLVQGLDRTQAISRS